MRRRSGIASLTAQVRVAAELRPNSWLRLTVPACPLPRSLRRRPGEARAARRVPRLAQDTATYGRDPRLSSVARPCRACLPTRTPLRSACRLCGTGSESPRFASWLQTRSSTEFPKTSTCRPSRRSRPARVCSCLASAVLVPRLRVCGLRAPAVSCKTRKWSRSRADLCKSGKGTCETCKGQTCSPATLAGFASFATVSQSCKALPLPCRAPAQRCTAAWLWQSPPKLSTASLRCASLSIGKRRPL